ncbi:MAG: CAP domain-containing protein [Rhodomicrobium sp.]|nr:CAP domain-containing protein [Rhodomicrobium sp.]
MFRILASLLLISILPGCAITPPSSFFAPLANSEEQPEKPPHKQEPAPAKEAGIGSSISSLWDSVKSGLSFGSKTEVRAPGDSAVNQLDPQTAQQLVNAYRAQNGLKPLRLNTRLAEAATRHSEDLAKNDRISHYGSDGSDTWDRVRRTGYEARMTAENVGTGQRSIAEVFRGWQNSPDHNANLLLKDAEEMGIGMVYSDKTQFKTFWTLVIGSPASETAIN